MTDYNSRTEYTGTGVQTAFTIDWDDANGHYVSASDVKAKIDGIETTAFSVSGNTVTFDVAPASGSDILIYRQTALNIVEQFTRLGTPSSASFNNVMRRLQYIGQELIDIGVATADAATSALMASRWAQQTGSDITGGSVGDRSAKSWAQENLAGATYGGSAKDWAQSASLPDGTNKSAKSYATDSATSASESALSAASSATSASNASDSEDLANQWAEEAEDVEVTPGHYSSFHWAQKAAETVATGVPDADATTKGKVELATVGEALTGTDATRAVTPDSLAALWERGADIASAATLTFPSAGGGYFVVTGTTTITALSDSNTPKNGRTVRVRFSGALTLTHNATSLILPGSANITTASGDTATFTTEDGTNWRCVQYQKANGQAVVAPSSGVLTVSYDSGDQTLTAGGNLTLAHGLGAKPKLIRYLLVCRTSELNYSVGDEVDLTTQFGPSAGSYGMMAVSDSTNINIRFGSNAIIFLLSNKSTGAAQNIAIANWKLIVRAYA